MIGRHTESMNKETTITFIVGEEVMINEGPFTSMKATIEKIEDHKVTLVVSIFGRKTPLTLDSHQIDKMHA
jgi:transcriptional antiterminator NusG